MGDKNQKIIECDAKNCDEKLIFVIETEKDISYKAIWDKVYYENWDFFLQPISHMKLFYCPKHRTRGTHDGDQL